MVLYLARLELSVEGVEFHWVPKHCVCLVQMLGLPTFAISYPNEEALLVEAEDAGHLLDPRDFDVNGYPVDEKTYPKIGKETLKEKRQVDDNEDAGEADIHRAAGVRASSSSMVGDDNSFAFQDGQPEFGAGLRHRESCPCR